MNTNSLIKYLRLILPLIQGEKIVASSDNKIIDSAIIINKKLIEIFVYFPTPIHSYYQLAQWLLPITALNEQHKVVFVVRSIDTFQQLSTETALPVIYVQTLSKLRELYKTVSPAITLYVSNAQKNTQSLLYKQGFHIYLNHGESEKECMSSNQSKAYDYVFTAGQRGIDRYKENLLNVDDNKYLIVGRPQLDFFNTMSFTIDQNKKVILYAPTWEAHYAEMDYCSLEKYGLSIVNEIIKNSQYILIYKPHPAIGTQRKPVRQIHKAIISTIEKADNAHFINDRDINNIFGIVDYAFFDNSSIMIDYLFFDKPAAYIEIRNDIKINSFLDAFSKFTVTDMNKISSFIESSMVTGNSERKKVKEYYLGGFSKGRSSIKFVKTISDLVARRGDEMSKKMLKFHE